MTIAALNQNLGNFSALSSKISDPGSQANASDIVASQQASAAAEVSVAVLQKTLEVQQQAVDVIA